MEIQELKIDEIKSEPLNVVESSNSGGNKERQFWSWCRPFNES